MSRNKGDSQLYTDWLTFAENDLFAAKALSQNERTLALSAFCSHQAIEKSLKAYLLYRQGYAPDGHNVIFLCKSAMKSKKDFSDWLDECVELNNYYIITRYPPDFPLELSKSRVTELRKMARRLYAFVFKTLAVDVYGALPESMNRKEETKK